MDDGFVLSDNVQNEIYALEIEPERFEDTSSSSNPLLILIDRQSRATEHSVEEFENENFIEVNTDSPQD